MLNSAILSLMQVSYRIESWALLGLLAVFIALYGIRTFKRCIDNAEIGTENTKTVFARDPFPDVPKSHLKLDKNEVPIEKSHSYTNAKATKSHMPSKKLDSKVDTKKNLKQLREMKK